MKQISETIWVIIKNKAEHAYLNIYCEERGDSITSLINCPMAIILNNETGKYEGWSDSMNRAATYVTFKDFINGIDEQEEEIQWKRNSRWQ